MMTIAHNKKEAKAEVTRKKILVAASKLFARRGYHKTTITDIAQAILGETRLHRQGGAVGPARHIDVEPGVDQAPSHAAAGGGPL